MVYAKAARERGDDIRLMASIETIGWYSNRPGTQRYPPLFNLSSRSCELHRYGVRLPVRGSDASPLQTIATFRSVPGVSWSDHQSFWRQDYRAMMITDTAPYRYPYYHAAADTPDKLAYPEFYGGCV